MRITDIIGRRDVRKGSDGATRQKERTSLFLEELTSQTHEMDAYDTEIDQLRQEIDQAGDKLTREPTLQNFTLFRELLSKLAKRINAEAYKLEKYGGTPQNPRYFEIVTVIDREADRLYGMIVNEHRDSMAITAKVIGIKGLVVDLIT